MAAAGRRRRELVEEREVGTAATRSQPVDLGPSSPREPPADATNGPWEGTGIHRLTS